MKFSRRDFSKMLLGAAALGLVETSTVAKVFGQQKKRSILWLSSQTASNEGLWANLKIDGKVPKGLNGTLFRTAPGMTENFGTPLNHLFDGDAYLSSWRFREGKVELQGRFLQTPDRLKEIKAKKMLFNEYGTFAPNRNTEGKNIPSVNVIKWNGKLLGLSEGSFPTIINPGNFNYEGIEKFDGSIPDYLTFTAHPRFDQKTGDMFAYGIEMKPPGILHALHIERKTNKVNTLYKISLNGFYMVHDAMLTENYFIIIIPPMEYDVGGLMSRKKTLGDALGFNENKASRMLILPRDNKNGTAKPIEVELPSEMVFHYGNAYETKSGKIVFEMIAGKDKIILENLRKWKRDYFAKTGLDNFPQDLKQVTVDVAKKKVLSSVKLVRAVEFPRFDMRLTGQKSRYLYVTQGVYGENASIIRADLQKHSSQKVSVGKTRTVAEPVFVPKTSTINEDCGWILAQGYDADKNESFLEIRDAQTLDFAARVWANGQHFPLGFHGNFYSS